MLYDPAATFTTYELVATPVALVTADPMLTQPLRLAPFGTTPGAHCQSAIVCPFLTPPVVSVAVIVTDAPAVTAVVGDTAAVTDGG